MGDENPIRTLGDYSKPSHEVYRNTIELPEGNNVVPLRSDTIWLVQNGCSFHGLWCENPNNCLKDFLKLVDSLDLNGDNRERTRLHLFQFSLRDQASNWLERLPAGSITTWEDLTTLQIFYDHVTPATRRTIDQSAGGKLRDKNAEESWALLEDLALYDNESWDDLRDFAKPVKAISLPQDVPSTSDRRLIKLENEVQRLMEAHLALMQPTQVNKITSSCEICSGPHDTHYCMENPEQAFVDYVSLRTDEAGGKWYTFKSEQNNLGDTYNPSWKSHPNLRWKQPQNSQNNFSNPPNRFQPNGSIPNRSFNNNPQNFNNQSNLEGLVSNFMTSQDVRLSKFEADFKQQQSEMTNKINTVLKDITDRITGALPSNMVKNQKMNVNSTSLVLSARSYPIEDPQCSTQIHGPSRNDKEREIKWLDVKEPLDLVDTSHKFTANAYIDVDLPMNIMSLAYYNTIRKNGYEYMGRNFVGLGRDMHIFVGNMSYVMDFTILENIETNIDPSLSHVIFGRPFIEIACLAINRKHGLMTFTDGTKEITFKIPYKDPERSKLSNEGHELLSSRIILSEDDYDRGCRKPSDLDDGFYRDTINLGPEYVTGKEDEEEATKFLIKNEEEIFKVRGDGVGINPDGVAFPTIVNPKVSLYISYPADFTLGVVVFVFDLHVIFDEKKLGSS
ncbi:hypothetical protein Tco_1182592 [Tanacetum coccineum]